MERLYAKAKDASAADALAIHFLERGLGAWVPASTTEALTVEVHRPDGTVGRFRDPGPDPSLAEVAEIQAQLLERDAAERESAVQREAERYRAVAASIRQAGRPDWLAGDQPEAWRLAFERTRAAPPETPPESAGAGEGGAAGGEGGDLR